MIISKLILAPPKKVSVLNIWEKIKDLLQPGAVNTMTRLALVSAIYFKGNWMHPFCEEDTRETLNFILLMVILLPQKSTDGSDPLHKVHSMLTQEQLEKWTSRRNMSTTTKISITVPKFKFEMSYDMIMPLAKMGMTDVFCEEKADLSRMNGKKGLFLSTMTHRAFVDVNEKGTEAAASVAMTKTWGLLDEMIYFTANRPFLFFIRHNKTKSILFLGRFSSP
uniref:Serpin domain-containing protein n=1 Tax=Sphaeramia orbicularis TaxID=375764 RepID=A0A672YXU3_9TELE